LFSLVIIRIDATPPKHLELVEVILEVVGGGVLRLCHGHHSGEECGF
jgi:hypothetical protein